MIAGHKVLAVVPARGQSKGVSRKNLRALAGKPLIAWTIEAARQSKYIDRLIVSSEDAEILSVAKELGCEAPFVRPAALAQDETPGIDPVLHALEQIPGYELVVLLQPTSPFRIAEDIDGCIERCVSASVKSCVTVSEVEQHPRWMFTIDANNHLLPVVSDGKFYARRQDLPPVYMLNGAVYVADSAWLKEKRTFLASDTAGYVMPGERSMDIDTEADLKACGEMIEGKDK